MKFVERRERSYKELIQAVKGLRAHLGDSQQAFATRFGVSIRSIANYEKDRKPEDRILAHFAKAASDAGRGDLAMEFMAALGKDLGLSDIKGGTMSYSPSDRHGYMLLQFEGEEGRRYASAFFLAMSRSYCDNPELRARMQAALRRFAEEVTKGGDES
jgi:transcriptional regulator with XRE-family HTH domain